MKPRIFRPPKGLGVQDRFGDMYRDILTALHGITSVSLCT